MHFFRNNIKHLIKLESICLVENYCYPCIRTFDIKVIFNKYGLNLRNYNKRSLFITRKNIPLSWPIYNLFITRKT